MKKLLFLLIAGLLLIPLLAGCSSAAPTTQSALPHSMKGYELYSWEDGGQWHFTLITGTNRTKTLEEITTGEDEVTEDGWVRIHAVGIAGAKGLLDRLPSGEFVIWNSGIGVNPVDEAVWVLVYPDTAIVSEIEAYAVTLGLDFMVPLH